jgi:hypothetical protein
VAATAAPGADQSAAAAAEAATAAAAEAATAAAAAAERAAAQEALDNKNKAEKLLAEAAKAEHEKAQTAASEARTAEKLAGALGDSTSINKQNINEALKEITDRQDTNELIIDQNKEFVNFMLYFNKNALPEVKDTLITYNKNKLLVVQSGFMLLETKKIKAISRDYAYTVLNYALGPTKLYKKAQALMELIKEWNTQINKVSADLYTSIAEAKIAEFGIKAIQAAKNADSKMNASPVKKIVENYLQLTVYADAIKEAENSAPYALQMYRADKLKDTLSAVAGGVGSAIYKFFTTGNLTAKKQLGLSVVVGVCALAAGPFVATGGLAALAVATASTAALAGAANAAASIGATKAYGAVMGKTQAQGTIISGAVTVAAAAAAAAPQVIKSLADFASKAQSYLAGKPSSRAAGQALAAVVTAQQKYTDNPAGASSAIAAAEAATKKLKPEAADLLTAAMVVAAGGPKTPIPEEALFLKLLNNTSKFNKPELQNALSEVCGKETDGLIKQVLITEILTCVRKNPNLKAKVEAKQILKKGGRRTRKQQQRRRRQTRRHW